MVVEAYHDWGCGVLNGTGPCCCGEGWTVEAIGRDAKRQIAKPTKGHTQKISGLTMAESLKRLDKIAEEAKNQ